MMTAMKDLSYLWPLSRSLIVEYQLSLLKSIGGEWRWRHRYRRVAETWALELEQRAVERQVVRRIWVQFLSLRATRVPAQRYA
jgi:hypothetical protein